MFNKKKKEVEVEETKFRIVSEPQILKLPDVEVKQGFDIKYPLIEPYAYAHIYWDNNLQELIYAIEEPDLNEQEADILKNLEQGIKELINISFINVNDQKIVIEYLEKNLRVMLKELSMDVDEDGFLKLMYYIYRDFVGLNEIEPLMRDFYIEDIECNGFDTPIYIVHRKYRNLKTSIVFKDMKKLARFVEKLAQKCGKYVSYAEPLLDGRLPDNSRVNATYTEDVSSRGPTFTIRKFTKVPWTPVRLMDFRTVSPEILAYLWILIEHESNMMIIGGTGSGKTSFLNSIAFFIPPAARIVSIEDTKELNLLHENWLPSVARTGFGSEDAKGRGEVDLFDLLKESFRQRPDYVIVGEVRGREANVLFQGMSSGHPSFGTFHAESVDTLIKRLETRPIELSPSLINALDVVCIMNQVKVGGQIVRRLSQVVEIVDVKENGTAVTNTPFVWDPRKDVFMFKTDSYVFKKIMDKKGINREELFNEFNRRARLLMALYQRKMYGFKEVHQVISAYYKSPMQVLNKFGVR